MISIKTATFLLVAFSVLSKILGIAREIIIAYLFGTSSNLDAYIISMTIPNNIMHLIVSSTFLIPFISVFSKHLANNNEIKAWKFTSNVINMCAILFGLFIPITILFAPYIVKLFAPGFKQETYNLAVSLTRIMLPSMIFFSLATVTQGILNSYQYFTTPGLKSIVLNLTMITTMILGYRFIGIYSLAIGFLLSSIFQLLIQLPALFKRMKKYFLNISFDEDFINFVNFFLPLIIITGINELNILVDMQSSENIFGVSLATVLFPKLTTFKHKGNLDEFENILSKGITILFFSTLPITFLYIFFGGAIIRLVFQRGAFDTSSTLITNRALFYYSFAAFFMSANYVLLRALYALEKIKVVVVITSVSLIINFLLNILLSKFMGIGGITLATSISTGILFLSAFNIVLKQIGMKNLNKIIPKFGEIFLIQFFSFFVGWLVYMILKINFISAIFISFIIFIILSSAFKIEEYFWIKDFLFSKFRK
jgi:putative peptidoglycan lipid II flippase